MTNSNRKKDKKGRAGAPKGQRATKKKSRKQKMKEGWGKKKLFLLNVEPYRHQVLVVLNGQFGDAYKWMQKNLSPKALKTMEDEVAKNKESCFRPIGIATGEGRIYTSLPIYVILVSHQGNWIESVDVVVHEVMHLCHHLLQKVGINLNDETEEAYTYLLGRTVGRILMQMY